VKSVLFVEKSFVLFCFFKKKRVLVAGATSENLFG
jgi:hypothetical protein